NRPAQLRHGDPLPLPCEEVVARRARLTAFRRRRYQTERARVNTGDIDRLESLGRKKQTQKGGQVGLGRQSPPGLPTSVDSRVNPNLQADCPSAPPFRQIALQR